MSKITELYVSPNGLDTNCGSKDMPLATVKGAVSAVRELIKDGLTAPVTVNFTEGEYKADNIELTAEDSGTKECPVTYKALGDVTFSNGIAIGGKDFAIAEDERISADARGKVYCFDLKKFGMSVNQSGRFAIKNDMLDIPDCMGDDRGNDMDIFWDDKRLFVAKYPNEGFRPVVEVLEPDNGDDVREHMAKDHLNKVILIEDEIMEHIKGWSDPASVWMYGYFKFDWASAAAPVSAISPADNKVFMTGVAGYGIAKDGTYYFYNALEEVDMPGEYFIDKKTLMLYVYPYTAPEAASITISLSQNPIIKINGASNIAFEGITFTGTFGNALEIRGNNNTFSDCTVKNIHGWAARVLGDGNKFYGCEITRTGKGGISITSGDRVTLTHGNNIVENCYIHDWAELYPTYNPGIELTGCGNIATHNELARNAHMAIYYDGNEHLIEYNYLHEVVQLSHDMGAIYGGRDWAGYGNVIRYNIIENAGNDKFFPCGIYWDDCQSGQRAYGNILMNATGKAFLIGGGRDNVVENNMMLMTEYPVLYDERARDGILEGGWYHGADKPNGNNWPIFRCTPVHNDAWKEKYPMADRAHDDYEKYDDPDCIINPARAVIRNNIAVYPNDYGWFVAKSVERFGSVANNLLLHSLDECFENAKKYELKPEIKAALPEFKEIPVEEIGRYRK